MRRLLLATLTLAAALPSNIAAQAVSTEPVVVASKDFSESFLLAELFAQLLEQRGVEVDRRFGLGATEIAFSALRSGAIDVYPEYTGTGLVAILNREPVADPQAVFATIASEFRGRWGVRWLPPLGFENTYAIAVRPATADSLGLRTMSDVGPVSSELVAGFTPGFIGRADGLPGLAEMYDLEFGGVRSLIPAVKYQALNAGSVDIIDGFSTDGMIARYDLVILEDDRRYFPPYEAAALVSRRVADSMPVVVSVLSELSGRIDVTTMRRYNRLVEVDGQSIPDAAKSLLIELNLSGETSSIIESEPSVPPLVGYLLEQRSRILSLTLRHLLLVGVSLLLAILVAVPLGLLLESSRGSAETTIRVIGTLQTIPSIALLAFMIPLLGIGIRPAIVALFLYSLYPILRNTYTGVRDAAPAAVAGAVASGMTPSQVLRYVRLPLAAPVIMAGVRTAAVINVGTATLAAFIGAGGLGDPIVAGLALSDTGMILSGAIPAALLALLVDSALGQVERAVTPAGV